MMTQIETKIESTNQENCMTSWRIWLTSMSQVLTMLKSDRSVCDMHAIYRTIMDGRFMTLIGVFVVNGLTMHDHY